jgi:glycosyltransferase involved in cell wall biosynthesis
MNTVEKLGAAEVEQHHAGAVAVITPTIPGREQLLAEAKESVLDQTVPTQHLIGLDARPEPEGPAIIRNVLLARASELGCEYVAFLDDDDLLDPTHIEDLTTALAADHATIAMSWYRRVGDAPETPRFYVWDDWCLGTMLGGRNLIPITTVCRLDAIMSAGGFDPNDRYEDYSLWLRMLDQGATITVVPRETWTYRQIGGNRTWQ